jgi:hypothetical protein
MWVTPQHCPIEKGDTEAMTQVEATLIGEQPDESIRYANARALTDLERHHPLAESGWHVVGHSTLDGEIDTLLLERRGAYRLIELFEDYEWVKEKRKLSWQEFLEVETEIGDRRGWVEAIHSKLEAYGHAIPEPHLWMAQNDEFGADWMLGLEF